jgi:hypothetical protein
VLSACPIWHITVADICKHHSISLQTPMVCSCSCCTSHGILGAHQLLSQLLTLCASLLAAGGAHKSSPKNTQFV